MTIQRPRTGWQFTRVTTHPGEVLLHDYIEPLGLSANQIAVSTRMPATRIGEVIKGRRGVTADTALRLARYFGTSPQFWLNLQANHDLSAAMVQRGRDVMRDVQPLAS